MSTFNPENQNIGQAAPQEVSVHEELVRLYPYVRGFVKRHLGSMSDWEDVVQEVYCSSLLSLSEGKFEGRSSLRTWVYKVMTHKIKDAFRGRWQLKEFLFLEGFDYPSPEKSFEKVYEERDLEEKFIERFARSSPRLTLILKLFVQGFSQTEIAEIVGLSVRRVHTYIKYARIRLRRLRGEINEFLG